MMKYSASLIVPGNSDQILELFSTELGREAHDRANVVVEKNDAGVIFKVEATDSVALRAHLLGLTKLLTVIEEMDKTK